MSLLVYKKTVLKVSKRLKISEHELLSGCRQKRITYARAIVSRHLRRMHGYSYPKIAKLMGMHHTSIMAHMKGKK